MDAVDKDRSDQLAVEFASQAIFFAGIRAVDAQNGLQLFEEQLDLPAYCIKCTDHLQRQPTLGNIGNQQRPVAHTQVVLADSSSFLLGLFLQSPASLIGDLFAYRLCRNWCF